ncbi:type 1 glutamine amidotransferase [Propionivibrio soli]|uniref:type 1 glutamine amidotransferase n=1 Tax=Propionivibrio soli TaxID=2976531 RepID=UPI0021E9368E|nr:type 1 glutamine amidotransferase [Propionivibrio soli]
MKPVVIVRHAETEGPGYFATFLEKHSVPHQLVAIDRDEPVPVDVSGFSGLCLMGGPMSVNDALPWINEVCALIRESVAAGIPVIGHCLGGQLLSKALGGTVTRSPVKEIGWGLVRVEDSEETQRWLGGHPKDQTGEATVFQWHGETFGVPDGACRIFTNDFCANQAFVFGPHLGMQFHVEMTAEMIAEWCTAWPAEVAGLSLLPASVQTPEQMQAEAVARIPALRRLADQLYASWLQGVLR